MKLLRLRSDLLSRHSKTDSSSVARGPRPLSALAILRRVERLGFRASFGFRISTFGFPWPPIRLETAKNQINALSFISLRFRLELLEELLVFCLVRAQGQSFLHGLQSAQAIVVFQVRHREQIIVWTARFQLDDFPSQDPRLVRLLIGPQVEFCQY